MGRALPPWLALGRDSLVAAIGGSLRRKFEEGVGDVGWLPRWGGELLLRPRIVMMSRVDVLVALFLDMGWECNGIMIVGNRTAM
jgi:hypothetical protein